MNIEITNYKDGKGDNFKVGDIVYNPCFGDLWVVQKTTKEDKEMYGIEDPYLFAKDNDKDIYCMDISEPRGFVIYKSPDEKDYDILIKSMEDFAKQLKEDLDE